MKTIEIRVQLAPVVHKAIKKIATNEGRSMSKQITFILKEIADKAK